jgi:hypothetical protein
MDEEAELNIEEKWIIIKSLQCLHNLKYLADLAIINQKNSDLIQILIEEVVKIRESLHDK